MGSGRELDTAGLAITCTSELVAPSQHRFCLGWGSAVTGGSRVDRIRAVSAAMGEGGM